VKGSTYIVCNYLFIQAKCYSLCIKILTG